jgi:hypothetical protein
MKRLYLDANISPDFADALTAFERSDGLIEILSVKGILGDKASDLSIVSDLLTENDGYFLSCDKDFKNQIALRDKIIENNLGWFFYKGANFTHWDRVTHIMSCWVNIRKKILNRHEPKPFCYTIHKDGKLELKPLF